MAGIIGNFFGKGKYPAFSIYDESSGHYKTKLHPLMKILIVIEGLAIVVIAISGIVLYSARLVFPWAPYSILDSFGRRPVAPSFGLVFPGVSEDSSPADDLLVCLRTGSTRWYSGVRSECLEVLQSYLLVRKRRFFRCSLRRSCQNHSRII